MMHENLQSNTQMFRSKIWLGKDTMNTENIGNGITLEIFAFFFK